MTRIRRPSLLANSNILRQYVEQMGGTAPIQSILIANNGIAAVKEIRSVRKWAYETFGDESAIQFVAMATPEDLLHNAEYIRMADHFVPVPGGSNNNNYKNVDLIVELAERTGVDAVWAGWGHASEDPRLPDSLHERGIIFIGPPGSAMRALGDKISSTIVAQSANVPTMGWSGNDLITDARNAAGYIDVPEDIYMKACVKDVEQAISIADEVGYPLMIKASEGGGGKGIRKVTDPMQFRAAFAQVAAEVPGSPIFLMRLASGARHLEVQILADAHGNVISLFGRDCSVQRRHQKIIEEAPVTIAGQDIFEQMEMSAVRLAQLVGYVNAGTVEFLYDPAANKYFFLELNPRLQVEHPTTEMVSGVNIPAAQLMVAMGIPLHRIPHVRLLYGLQPNTTSEIDFHFDNVSSTSTQRRPAPTGHVIACRITAENPDAGFKPSGGQLVELNFRSSTDVWGYFSVSANGGLHEFADSQFGHVFAYGHDRPAARRNMIMALKELRIRGDFRTTVEYLITLLETAEFSSNNFSTEWLDGRIEAKMTAERPDRWVSVVCGAAVAAFGAAADQQAAFLRSLDKGQVPSLANIKHAFDTTFILENKRYDMRTVLAAQDLLVLTLNGSSVVVRARALVDGGILVTYADKSQVVYATEDVAGTRLAVNGKTVVLEQEADPSQIRSPSPGKLVRWLIPDGGHVDAGQAFAEIEVMKMIMPLVATDPGHFASGRKQPGSPIASGELLATLVLDDMSQVKKAEVCYEKFPAAKTSASLALTQGDPSTKPHLRYMELRELLNQAMSGFEQILPLPKLLDQLASVLQVPSLPFLHTQQVFSAFRGRLPEGVEVELEALLMRDPSTEAFPHAELLAILSRVPDAVFVAPIVEVVKLYELGPEAHHLSELTHLLSRYETSEGHFVAEADVANLEKTVLELRARMDSEAVYWMCFSHARIAWKTQCVGYVLDAIAHGRKVLSQASNSAVLFDALHQLAELGGAGVVSGARKGPHQVIQLRARALLISLQLPDFDERSKQFAEAIDSLVQQQKAGASTSAAADALLHSPFSVFDVLPAFFFDSDKVTLDHKLAALDLYVRRAYNAYRVHAINTHPSLSVPTVEWHFQFTPHDLGIGNARSVSASSLAGPSSSVNNNASAAAAAATAHLRTASASDMTLMVNKGDIGPVRVGFMATVRDLAELQSALPEVIELFPRVPKRQVGKVEPWHVLNIAVMAPSAHDVESPATSDTALASMFGALLAPSGGKLRAHGIRRVTILVYRTGQFPQYFTYRERLAYAEDATIRNIEPSHAFQLELHRLSKFSLVPVSTPTNRSIHLYHAKGKDNPLDSRFFVRALVRSSRLVPQSGHRDTVDYLTTEADNTLNDTLNSLELASAKFAGTDCNHLFLNFLHELPVSVDEVSDSIAGFLLRHGKRLWKLRITSAEIRFLCSPTGESEPYTGGYSQFASAAPKTNTYRFYVSNVSGVIKAERYRESLDEHTGRMVLHTDGTSAVSGKGEYHLQPADHAYPNKEMVQPKRYRAHVMGTTYVYDYVDLFREALAQQWARYPHVERPAGALVEAHELVLGEDGQVRKVIRPIGNNTCGMVAWVLDMKTPECPKGRQIVVIANDITFAIGSFGPVEDDVFNAASRYARELGIPRLYVSANSGARIGLAEEVLGAFRIAWINDKDAAQGFKYLYLTIEDHERLKDSVVAEPELDETTGEKRMRLVAIIGAKDGLGVENLMGSGLIAGETSRAYDEIFTATLVACRSVGIGAYLVRLGQRAVQVEGQPIILTGAAALNKVLGREVYTSNLQLGGIQIMHRNGVSHLTCVDPLHGVAQLVHWLSYVPAHRGAPLPILKSLATPVGSDSNNNNNNASVLSSPSSPTSLVGGAGRESVLDEADRDIDFEVTKQPYDPRHMLHGHEDAATGAWVGGFFDRGSWMETMDGWSKTVVVGRGRLGGVPLGAIAVETRVVDSVVPADPANPESSEQTVMEPPGVWTPASAYKTAQAIRDLGREGLPLIIFANWRGFSGGQRDMYDAVLKYGSYIVDALRTYPCPVFVYIVPHGELRGGAWVVLDPSIHQDGGMEMYADKTSRGGVLEPEGMVEIKFRKPQMLSTIERLDADCRRWKGKLNKPTTESAVAPPTVTPSDSAVSVPAAAALGASAPTSSDSLSSSSDNDHDSSDDERETVQTRLVERQEALLPAYHQAALKFADLHDMPERMKAKGAIRVILEWRSARRFFHWRVRRRVAEDRLRAEIKAASPDLPRPDVDKLMRAWFAEANGTLVAGAPAPADGGEWDTNDQAVAEWLEMVGEFSTAPQSVTAVAVRSRIDALETAHLSAVVAKILRNKPQAAVAGLAQSLLGGGTGADAGTALASFAALSAVLQQ
ncbi:carboxyl transferase domain-containing protein [Blastocladiella britannica]|nr:carboxyl transferase domain-containing protein [Blastocladiella britannica]